MEAPHFVFTDLIYKASCCHVIVGCEGYSPGYSTPPSFFRLTTSISITTSPFEIEMDCPKMLKLSLLLLVGSTTINALSISYWVTQQMAKIEQAPLVEGVASFAPPALFPEEQLPATVQTANADKPAISKIYEFKDQWVGENIAARSTGDLLLTATSHAAVWLMGQNGGKPKLVANFTNATSSLGIQEVTPDRFIVAVGNYSTVTFQPTPGTFSVWSVDFNTGADKNTPNVTQLVIMPNASALNGMTTLDGVDDMVLISDSALGAVWRVNTTTGAHEVAMKHVLFTNCSSKFPLGINGIRSHDGHLYFLNSAQQIYGRVKIDATGSATADPEIIAHAGAGVFAWDDLAIDWEGNAWIATHANMVTEVTVDGKQRNFTGDGDTELQQPTSITWGRPGQGDSKVLYIVTAGNTENKPVCGQVFSLDTRNI